MTAKTAPAKQPKVDACAYATTTPGKDVKHVPLPMPLPCITILVHGVNDVGEAYAAQETGLCQGLNARLDRAHELGMNARPDLRPATYKMPPATAAEARKEGIVSDPDAVYFRRATDRNTHSPVVPFYWGSRENGGIDPQTGQPYIKKDNWHGQWTDRYGNRLDKNGAKNGGPFANATTCLNAMWGEGFNGKVADSEILARFVGDPLHNLRKACPRHYMLLAAKRLAMLIKIIRNNPRYKNVAINLVCHSQGSMVSLAAHALLDADGGQYAADTLIVQDPPYSVEETTLEFLDGVTGYEQQTTQSRIKTLSNIVGYIYGRKSSTPSLKELEFPPACGSAVAGPNWKSGQGAKQWAMGEVHPFTERDNRGKVYLYFCPHDSTVALKSVQGIGWQGVPDEIKVKDVRLVRSFSMDGGAEYTSIEKNIRIPVLSTLGKGFRQRVFTSRQVDGKILQVGAPECRYELRSKSGVWLVTEDNSTTGKMSASVAEIERGATRQITGEELNPKVHAILTAGEGGHAGKLAVSPIDAAIATAAGTDAIPTSTCRAKEFRTGARRGAVPLTPDEIRQLESSLPGQRAGARSDDDRLRVVSVDYVDIDAMKCTYSTETANEARARWQAKTDASSYHSAVPGNPAHAAGVTAYDLSLGAPFPVSDDDKAYLDYLCAVADWRTNWRKMEVNEDNPKSKNILKHYSLEKDESAKALIVATFAYFTNGVLPDDIVKNDKASLPPPKLMVSHTVAERASGKLLR
ncbi:DUF3274 domain-containing protein [Massilia sp. R2A-15]|uniref:T6SS effector phospholipase Tle3 domain-containing protein n=1 Tax=Massilia sp. R2A-15 TaxID=3064278 RepID=UPI002735F5DE|nr:DUF3274 domain-containing protein [Massilia sp. R2A-15]WLI90452.1 DUF3274 domain-containing protein [Massilia sp. R2A-15]